MTRLWLAGFTIRLSFNFLIFLEFILLRRLPSSVHRRVRFAYCFTIALIRRKFVQKMRTSSYNFLVIRTVARCLFSNGLSRATMKDMFADSTSLQKGAISTSLRERASGRVSPCGFSTRPK